MMLYDGMSYLGGRLPGVPHHRHLSKRQVMMAAPGLAEHATVGGMTYFDGHAKWMSKGKILSDPCGEPFSGVSLMRLFPIPPTPGRPDRTPWHPNCPN
jgi:hypothetical protein